MSTSLGQASQNLHDSLELKDSQIYCQRASKLYDPPEPSWRDLFKLTVSSAKILAMFDPSMLGREKLVVCLKEMDNIRLVNKIYQDEAMVSLHIHGHLPAHPWKFLFCVGVGWSLNALEVT